MAENKVIIAGGIQPSTKNTPGDVRERVTTYSKIADIENPSVGATVWVEDEAKEYRIWALTSKEVGGILIENAAVDMDQVKPTADEAVQQATDSITQNVAYESSTGTLELW